MHEAQIYLMCSLTAPENRSPMGGCVGDCQHCMCRISLQPLVVQNYTIWVLLHSHASLIAGACGKPFDSDCDTSAYPPDTSS